MLVAARLYWCFGYEAKNQEIKRAAMRSNYMDVVASVVKFIAVKVARNLKKRVMARWMPDA